MSEREQAREAAFVAWWGRDHESRLLVDLWDMGADWQAEQDAEALNILADGITDLMQRDEDWHQDAGRLRAALRACLEALEFGRKNIDVVMAAITQARAALGESSNGR